MSPKMLIAERALRVLVFAANWMLDRDRLSRWVWDVAKKRIAQGLPTVTGFGARFAIVALKKHNVAAAGRPVGARL
jgi:hypothetical protein